jgi:hypothetical protein
MMSNPATREARTARRAASRNAAEIGNDREITAGGD